MHELDKMYCGDGLCLLARDQRLVLSASCSVLLFGSISRNSSSNRVVSSSGVRSAGGARRPWPRHKNPPHFCQLLPHRLSRHKNIPVLLPHRLSRGVFERDRRIGKKHCTILCPSSIPTPTPRPRALPARIGVRDGQTNGIKFIPFFCPSSIPTTTPHALAPSRLGSVFETDRRIG
jgi:hypothetical protein